jgi:hypothetical protein
LKKDPHSKALVNENTGALITDWGEIAIDQFIGSGLLKDIPLLGSLVNLYKSGQNVRDYLLQKKVEEFLDSHPSITLEEAEAFNDEMDSDPKFKARVAEQLTLSLDRLDDIEKSGLLSKAFSKFVKGDIEFDNFKRIARAIERCFIDDLREVHNFDRANNAFSEITYDLASNGLIEMVAFPQIQGPDAKPMYKITNFGELFVDIVFS